MLTEIPLLLNVGTGRDITIKSLAEKISSILDFKGDIVWDTSKPNGTPRKLLNSDRLKSLGWSPNITLDEGLKSTINCYKELAVTK